MLIAEYVDIKLAKLSANVIQLEKGGDKLRLPDSTLPETFRRWIEDAKKVQYQASRDLQIPKGKNGSHSPAHETPSKLHSAINPLLQNFPCRDGRTYDKLIRGWEIAQGSSSSKMKIIFFEISEEKLMRQKVPSKDSRGMEVHHRHKMSVGPPLSVSSLAFTLTVLKDLFVYVKHKRRRVIDLLDDFVELKLEVDDLLARWDDLNEDIERQSTSIGKNRQHTTLGNKVRSINDNYEQIQRQYGALCRDLESRVRAANENQVNIREQKIWTRKFFKLAKLEKDVVKLKPKVIAVKKELVLGELTRQAKPKIVERMKAEKLGNILPSHQGKIPAELISPQEDESMSHQLLIGTGITASEEESILSMEDLKAKSTSSEFKDQQQRQGGSTLNSSHLAKGSELRTQIEIEEIVTEACGTDINAAGRMSSPVHSQEQHESTHPDTEIPSMLATSSDMKSKMTNPEMERTPFEPVENESIPLVSEVELEAESGQVATETKIESIPFVSEVQLEADTGQTASEPKIESVPLMPEVEPEVERGQMATELKIEDIPSIFEVEPEPRRGQTATDLKIESLSSVSEVKPEAERDQTATKLKMSEDSTLSVDIAVSGKLSMYIDLKFETLPAFLSSKGQNAVNEFKYCDFTSEADNYCILMKENTRKTEVDQSKALEGGISLSEPPESFQNPNIKFPDHLILKPRSDMPIISLEEETWRQTGVMILRDSEFLSLPPKPDCPNLVLLFLQRNRLLRKIPEPFFSCMHSLRVVDLSGNTMSYLPPSLFGLQDLQVLILCNCMFLNELSDEIEGLVHLEVLDLSGTELNKAPDGIGRLTHMRNLQLTFYGSDIESQYVHLPQNFLSHGILTNLQSLEALSIVVHPEDVRWMRNAEAIMRDVRNLERLWYLEFYFPRVDILKEFIETSPSWPKIRRNKFKFVVGQNVVRFADRVPNDVEIKFNEHKRCMRFVNGEDVPEAVTEVLKCVTAFYLDHHQDIQSLSKLGSTTSKKIKFCIVRECPKLEAIIVDDQNVKPVYPSLEHLGMYYLWKLESICTEHPPDGSFRCLTSLVVNTCSKLEFILYESMLQYLHNLEELVVEDCENVKEIIRGSDGEVNDCISALPHKLRKLRLYYLPQLLTLWRKLEAYLKDPKPKEKLEVVVTVYACHKLDQRLLESIVVVKNLDSETVFQDEDETVSDEHAACSEAEENFSPGIPY